MVWSVASVTAATSGSFGYPALGILGLPVGVEVMMTEFLLILVAVSKDRFKDDKESGLFLLFLSLRKLSVIT